MSDDRPDTAPSPVHRPRAKSSERNVVDVEREGNGVHVDIGRKSLWGVAKVLGAVASLAAALGAGWQTHQIAAPAIEAKTAADVLAAQASAAATQKALEEHIARAEAQRQESARVSAERDKEMQAMQVNLAGIAQSLADLRGDVHDIKESLDGHQRRQPRNRPTPAPLRVDDH